MLTAPCGVLTMLVQEPGVRVAGLVLFVCYLRTLRGAAPKSLREVRTELVRRTFPGQAGYRNMEEADAEGLPPDPALGPAHATERYPLKQPHQGARQPGR